MSPIIPRGGQVAKQHVPVRVFGNWKKCSLHTRIVNIPPRGARGGCHEVTGGWGGGSRDGAARSENHAKGVDIITPQECISSIPKELYLITLQACITKTPCINFFEQLCCSNIVASFGLLTVKRRVSSVEDR